MLKLDNLALGALILLPIAAIAQTPKASMTTPQSMNTAPEEAAVEHVMKLFHDAVVAHDGASLSSLFLPDANIWLSV